MKESKYIPFTGKADIWMLDNIRCSGTTVIVNRVIDYYKEHYENEWMQVLTANLAKENEQNAAHLYKKQINNQEIWIWGF